MTAVAGWRIVALRRPVKKPSMAGVEVVNRTNRGMIFKGKVTHLPGGSAALVRLGWGSKARVEAVLLPHEEEQDVYVLRLSCLGNQTVSVHLHKNEKNPYVYGSGTVLVGLHFWNFLLVSHLA